MMSESIQHISIHALREEGDTQAAIIPTAPRYFYPRPPRGGRPHIVGLPSKNRVISIHALREEGDYGRFSQLVKVIKFLSTPSARRATTARPASRSCAKNFYPRPPRGGRHLAVHVVDNLVKISIHALREEGDWSWPCC